ncbi:DEAD-domain-containing protein [Violaceomyces palustris]|uniref:DEAD-domain-containing protein n=1 Tax=Violaceomyces palustris TaxID=1673888 RepID=A0ACD0P8G3_9BASI|nr:DEAD-domain-containing protein [Violaceomyces palustris]
MPTSTKKPFKRFKAKSKPSKPSGSSSSSRTDQSKPTRKQVPHSSLAWSTVKLPTVSNSAGGTTEEDFFQGFDENDAGFMGLQEVEGVEVVYNDDQRGNRLVKFNVLDQDPLSVPLTPQSQAKGKGKGKGKEEEVQDGEAEEELPFQDFGSDEQEEEIASQPVDTRGRLEEKDAAREEEGGNEEEEEEGEEEEEEGKAEGKGAESDAEDDGEMDDAELAEAFSKAKSFMMDQDSDSEEDDSFDSDLLPHWADHDLHPALKRALHLLKFTRPTEIQSRSLPLAMGTAATDSEGEGQPGHRVHPKKRDVIGISQTGSGKTLAYGLPILDALIKSKPSASSSKLGGEEDEVEEEEQTEDGERIPRPLGALIVTPTRELALQVSSHLNALIKASCQNAEDGTISKIALKKRPLIATVCGGMSEQKQRRLIEQGEHGVDIIVATPGRLWEMLRTDDDLALRLKRTRFLVLDEADRMVEVGHFAEMEYILNLVSRRNEITAPKGSRSDEQGEEGEEEEEEDGDKEQATLRLLPFSKVKANPDMQTFIFSATLSKELQVNLRKRRSKKVFSKKGAKASGSTLDDLMERVDFRDPSPKVVDLTPGQGLPEGLTETKVECLVKDKDLYLYYFLLRYPGRTLVFLNSIDGIRRITPILSNLGLSVFPLHSQLQQKQRLKNLDRFRSAKLSNVSGVTMGNGVSGSGLARPTSSVLLATDVAARGLDIPAVDHVVHYQLPRTADTYVHRSGRTARAGGKGVSVALVEPKEKRVWNDVNRALGRNGEINPLPVEYSFLPDLRSRIDLARQIDNAEHKQSKASHDESWLRNLAEEAELELTSDLDPDNELGSDVESKRKGNKKNGESRQAKLAKNKVRNLKERLEALLRKPMTARGVSHRYLTAGSREFVDSLIHQGQNETMIGVKRSTAQADLEKSNESGKVTSNKRVKKTKLVSE